LVLRAEGNAFLGVIDAIDIAFCRDGGQLANRPPTAAAHVEDRVAFPDRDLL
jgi:hypothetical protein